MALQTLLSFNKRDSAATGTKDYSTNGNNSTASANITYIDSEIDGAAIFNGTSSKITFSNTAMNFDGTDNLSIMAKVRISSTKEQVLAYVKDQWAVGFDVNAKAWLKLTIGASVFELTSSDSVATGGDYKVVHWTYDGSSASDQGKIFIDGVEDSNTMTQTGNVDTSAEVLVVGSDDTDWFAGRVEMLSGHSQTLTQAEVTTSKDKPGGFITDVPDSTNFSLGDLIELSAKGGATAGQCVVTSDLGSNQLLILPIASDIPQSGDILKHVGNVYDTARQCVMKTQMVAAVPTFYLYDAVSSFTLPTPKVQIDCNGITNPADPTNPVKVLRGDGSWGYVRLFSQYALKTITNTTTKTTLFGTGDGSPIVPAGYFDELGVMANLIMMGSWSKSVGGALTLLIEVTDSVGTTEIHRKEFTNAQLGGGGSTSGHWEIRMLSTCYATGATGSLMTHASLALLENNSAEILGTHSETSQVTIDFTGTIEMVVTAQWSVASTSLSIGSANVILKAQ